MRVYLHNVKAIYPGSSWHARCLHILVEDGIIRRISDSPFSPEEPHEILEDMLVSPSLCDLWCSSGEPGREYREDLISLRKVAEAGGYGQLFILPNTAPTCDHKTIVRSLLATNKGESVAVIPHVAISLGAHSEDMTEMKDISSLGITNFSDGHYCDHDIHFLERVGYYLKMQDSTLHCHTCSKKSLDAGQINQSVISTTMGLSGVPVWEEEYQVLRCINVAKETGVRMHVANISSQTSLTHIAQAKANNVDIMASVPVHNLLFTENDVQSFDENLKLNPPLRTESCRQALVRAVRDGLIDCVNSNHTPLSPEEKTLEFPYAEFGATGLQTVLPMMLSRSEFSPEEAIEVLAIRSRIVAGQALPKWEEGQPADFVVWRQEHRIYEQREDLSRSKNSPFFGKEVGARIYALLRH